MIRNRVGLVIGLLVLLVGLFTAPDGVAPEAWRVLALGAMMVIWWVSEAVPLPVTALLPVLLLPWLGVMPISEAARPYSSDIVFLFLGGFLLALAIEKWNLHRRISLKIVRYTGNSANRIVLGFMLATAVLSMWISNTAATVMMLPIALSVVELLKSDEEKVGRGTRNFGLALMLGIAYAANIGGTATLIGTPPNVVMAGILEAQHGIVIGFLDWMKIGIPVAAVLLVLTYLLLTGVLYPNRIGRFERGEFAIRDALTSLGAISKQEKRVLVVFCLTAGLWVSRQWLSNLLGWESLRDSGIAILGGILLFVVPSGDGSRGTLLDWADTRRLPWGILLLFGGGLSLANALNWVGWVDQVGEVFSGWGAVEWIWITLGLVAISLLLTEVMSNVALISVFVPVVAAIAVGMDVHPAVMAIPVTLAASCAFMLPMSTPPNAIVFASGMVRVHHMLKAGIVLNTVAILVIWLFSNYLVPLLFGR